MGVVVDLVGEGARTGVGRLRTGVCGLRDAGVEDAGLSLGMGVDAGEGGPRRRREACRGECAPERLAEWT